MKLRGFVITPHLLLSKRLVHYKKLCNASSFCCTCLVCEVICRDKRFNFRIVSSIFETSKTIIQIHKSNELIIVIYVQVMFSFCFKCLVSELMCRERKILFSQLSTGFFLRNEKQLYNEFN